MPQSSLASSDYASRSSRWARSVTTLLVPVEHIAQGERIRALREGRHLSQPQVLRGLEEQEGAPVISLRGYQLWEASKGKKLKGIKWENAVALARFFDVDAELLVTREQQSATPDAMAELNGERSQLDRIESLLKEIRDALVPATSTPAAEGEDRPLDDLLRGDEDEASPVEAPEQTQNPRRAQRS